MKRKAELANLGVEILHPPLKVTIHQSQYIPWPPYFRKIVCADIFVLMDNVQYQKNGVQNRNKLRNKNVDFWLTIPVTGHLGDSIADMKLADKRWSKKHWKTISMSYSKAPYWKLFAEILENLYSQNYSTLGEVNEIFLNFMVRALKIKTRIMRLSELGIKGSKSGLILSICKSIGANVYISGSGGKSYIKEDEFLKEAIAIEYKDSIPPKYAQFHGEFIPGLSMLDMMFNVSLNDIAEYLYRK